MIPDFIGVYDDVISQDQCKEIIERMEQFQNNGYGETRPNPEHIRSDKALFDHIDPFLSEKNRDAVMSALWQKGYDSYANQYSILNDCDKHSIQDIKGQITNSGQGYHIWHSEVMGTHLHRLLVYILYLNDIDEGGETEFLYYKKRIEPKAGRLLIFPAYFTHAHRGNTNLSDENKYILTGWYNFTSGQ